MATIQQSKHKVLHISGVAGIGSLLAKYSDTFPAKSFYADRGCLSSRLNEYYGGRPFPNMKKLIIAAVKNRKDFGIIHLHGFEIFVPIFKLLGKKTVLHYHGSDINIQSRNNNLFRIICRSIADVILIGEPEMQPKIIGKKKFVFLPNLVDTKSFSNIPVKQNGKALSIISKNLDRKAIKDYNLGVKKDITYYDISENPIIHIKDMPKFLAEYEYYIDNKFTDFGRYLDLLSSTGLQALSLCVKVIHNGKEITEFPEQYKPENIIKQLEGIYFCLIN